MILSKIAAASLSAVGALAASSVSHAAPLTYAAALAAAETSSPNLQARSLQMEGARAAARAAGSLPDPKLALGLDNFPISGPPAGRFNGDSMTMSRIGFVQDVPNGAKRSAEQAKAVTAIAAAGAAERLSLREVHVGAAVAWIDLNYAKARLKALDDLLAGLAPLWRATPSAVTSGKARPAQSLEAQQMRADLEDRRSELVAIVGRSRAELIRWTGDPDADVAGPAPSFEVDPGPLRAAIERNPLLGAQDAMTRQAETDVGLAQAGKRPDWSWELAYQRRDPMFGDMVSAGVTISLPIFASRRQDPIIASKVAAAGQARAEREALRREIVAQLETGLADHLMRHDQWRRSVDVLVPLAKQRADLETASYGAGRAGLTDVVQAFTQLADAQLTLLDREAAVATDAARLSLLYGSDDQ